MPVLSMTSVFAGIPIADRIDRKFPDWIKNGPNSRSRPNGKVPTTTLKEGARRGRHLTDQQTHTAGSTNYWIRKSSHSVIFNCDDSPVADSTGPGNDPELCLSEPRETATCSEAFSNATSKLRRGTRASGPVRHQKAHGMPQERGRSLSVCG